MDLFSRLFKRNQPGAKVPMGSVMPQTDLETRLGQLHAQLAEIDDLRGLSESRPWLKMRELLLAQICDSERHIVSLANDPVKYQVNLIETRAFRDALAAIVTMQDALPGEADRIRIKIEKGLKLLKETRDLPRPEKDESAQDTRPDF